MTEIKIIVPGSPIGKGRPRAAKRGAHITLYTPKETVNYENLVKMAASHAMAGRQPLECACRVDLLLFVVPPESWSKKKRDAAISGEMKPIAGRGYDIDNYAKSVFDGCNGIVWVDDKQVTTATIRKRYAVKPEAVMTVEEDC